MKYKIGELLFIPGDKDFEYEFIEFITEVEYYSHYFADGEEHRTINPRLRSSKYEKALRVLTDIFREV